MIMENGRGTNTLTQRVSTHSSMAILSIPSRQRQYTTATTTQKKPNWNFPLTALTDACFGVVVHNQ
jgi:hypothetical protein